jgi:hypothetical protein
MGKIFSMPTIACGSVFLLYNEIEQVAFVWRNNMSTLTAPPNVLEQNCADVETDVETDVERQREMWDYYEREVIRGLESGLPIPLTPEYWSDFLQKREERKTARQAEKKS